MIFASLDALSLFDLRAVLVEHLVDEFYERLAGRRIASGSGRAH